MFVADNRLCAAVLMFVQASGLPMPNSVHAEATEAGQHAALRQELLQLCKRLAEDCDEVQERLNMTRIQVSLEQDKHGQNRCINQDAAVLVSLMFSIHVYVVAECRHLYGV